MKLTQNLELRRLLAPELNQSLKILSLPLLDLKSLVDEELVSNPFLEERPAVYTAETGQAIPVWRQKQPNNHISAGDDFDPFAQLAKTPSFQDGLLRQLEISSLSSDELRIGKEIIGNIDDDGYLKTPIEEIAENLCVPPDSVESALKVIHSFEPAGVAARNIQECLLIQCGALNIDNPLIIRIIKDHLDDVAKRKYALIAKKLDASVQDVEACVKKITTLNPRPVQNFSVKDSCDIIPDIFIEEKNGDLEIFINKENIPSIYINEEYRHILKNDTIAPETKAFLKEKLQAALELLRAISRRQNTLRRVLEVITEIQKDALLNDLAHLRPLTFRETADRLEIHESTVCRVVMNKYAQTPQGIIAIKSLFTSSIPAENGEAVSSSLCKIKIRELVAAEDKTHPLSDNKLAGILLKENGVKLARRTVAKYREESKILPSSLRRKR